MRGAEEQKLRGAVFVIVSEVERGRGAEFKRSEVERGRGAEVERGRG